MKKGRRILFLMAPAALIALVGVPALIEAHRGGAEGPLFKADLRGFNEVPAISTTGHGQFEARLLPKGDAMEFELRYGGLEGDVTTAAHIHIGQEDVNGGVTIFLCGGGGRPPCTPTSGTFTGTITASDVLPIAAQGIAAGEFGEVVNAMRDGVTYTNVHTNRHPGGEIRGQLK